MNSPKTPLNKEKKTIRTMIYMYCKNIHDSNYKLCQDCSELFEYAEEKLKNCSYGENKPTCEKCPIHCYKPDAREKIQKVMRYAGPRMIYTHPVMGFRHLFRKIKKSVNPN
ncbi:MAG: nitrous oxide-stimulated promoter family protein [Candidatus Lokiarchaeota archaeon]|nr:nitrous oxide-stimulated promoter family protein [Candidatus Lokiarchaeota archaeon]